MEIILQLVKEDLKSMYAPPNRSLGRKIVEGIQATVILCLSAGVLVGINYGLHCLSDDPGFETEQECHHALFALQYREGHHGERCLELENGHWGIFDINDDPVRP